MSAHPAAGSLRRFSIDALPREAWKNGGGWTRTVASREAEHLLNWRVSVADITAAGPFSRFDGLDRTAVMVRGAGLSLSGDAQAWRFDGPGSSAQFPGELSLRCDAPDVPTQLWNVMVQRGQAQAKLLIVEDDAVDLTPAPDVLVLVLRGRFELALPGADSLVLNAFDCLHLQGLTVMAHITPVGANSLLLVTTLS
ncbi:MAG: HutD family protein [Rhodoferax sp.]|uniref:HutD/Ves family protein n=1 Tax=Rhodoferax sp. TaxID=50421 RepID=UPI002616B583|nr:HutD family protein [Rhodoferax sp.]MDD2881690.1 HutD family protein [Rhodoferax sp.]